ncbi:MAG: hypothetical protein R3A51_22230 [Nannocystaceae bacterium]
MPERVEIVETAALFADGQVLTALRPRDLMSLRFSLHDLEVLAPTTPLGPHRLRARSAGARLIVDFGPQHLVEDTAARQGDGSVTGLVAPMRTALASASRLVFQVPNGEVTPLTLAALLEGMQRWTLALPGPGPRTPTATETAIELPWRCVLAPFAEDPKTINWRHALTPGDGPYAPLWFTRLTAGCEARVITSPDHPRAGPLPHAAPTAPPLLASHRRELVTLTNSHGHARVDALALSSLGGWLDAEGRWPPTPGVDLVRWIHRVAAGRDQSVRTVERGYLDPLGHEAALITVSERTPVARARGRSRPAVREDRDPDGRDR